MPKEDFGLRDLRPALVISAQSERRLEARGKQGGLLGRDLDGRAAVLSGAMLGHVRLGFAPQIPRGMRGGTPPKRAPGQLAHPAP